MDNNLPPTNIEAEEAILGEIIFDPNALARIKDWLPPKAFYPTAHQIIYQACLALSQEGLGCDFIQLSDWLASRQLLEDVGGSRKLAELLNRTVSAINIDRYAQIVLEKYQRRQIIALGQQITQLGSDPYLKIEDIYQKIKDSLPTELSNQTKPSVSPSVSKAVYRKHNPMDISEEIELTADLGNVILLEDTMASIKQSADAIANRIWNNEQKKSQP